MLSILIPFVASNFRFDIFIRRAPQYKNVILDLQLSANGAFLELPLSGMLKVNKNGKQNSLYHNHLEQEIQRAQT